MAKIFIDTNIFLDFYRYNKNDNLEILQKEFKEYNNYFINTEQALDEFLRNREKTIREFIDTLNNQIIPIFDKNFLSSLEGFDDYLNSVKSANANIIKIKEACEKLILTADEDPVYILYKLICNKVYKRDAKIVELAIQRKYIGNPPTSNKNTCCDEIIWETLLKNCKEDLYIVSRDKTFVDNYNFLKREYEEKVGKKLFVVEMISDALKELGKNPSTKLENIESSIMLEKEAEDYFLLHDDSNWVSIIYDALVTLNGQAKLSDLYLKVGEIVKNNYPEKLNNKNIEATIRCTLQRFCGEANAYQNKADLFVNVGNGIWAIKNNDK